MARSYVGVTVRTAIRRLLLGTASVLALITAGSIANGFLDYGAGAGTTATAAGTHPVAGASRDALAGDALRTNDVRWAQVALRERGLYRGSLDGVIGPETRRGLGAFQKIKGLTPTTSLDAQTWEALTGSGIATLAAGSGRARPHEL